MSTGYSRVEVIISLRAAYYIVRVDYATYIDKLPLLFYSISIILRMNKSNLNNKYICTYSSVCNRRLSMF